MTCPQRYPDRPVGNQAALQVAFTEGDGETAIDLTVAGSQTWVRMVNALTGVEVFDQQVTIVNAQGWADYTPTLSQISTPGDYYVEWRHIRATGEELPTIAFSLRLLPRP